MCLWCRVWEALGPSGGLVGEHWFEALPLPLQWVHKALFNHCTWLWLIHEVPPSANEQQLGWSFSGCSYLLSLLCPSVLFPSLPFCLGAQPPPSQWHVLEDHSNYWPLFTSPDWSHILHVSGLRKQKWFACQVTSIWHILLLIYFHYKEGSCLQLPISAPLQTQSQHTHEEVPARIPRKPFCSVKTRASYFLLTLLLSGLQDFFFAEESWPTVHLCSGNLPPIPGQLNNSHCIFLLFPDRDIDFIFQSKNSLNLRKLQAL